MSETAVSRSVGERSAGKKGGVLHDAAVLFAITLIAGIILGFVYQITKNPIAVQEEKARTEACKEVFADAVTFEVAEEFDYTLAKDLFSQAGFSAQSLSDVVRAAKGANGELLGYVLTVTTSEGYGGDIVFTMGIRLDGTVNGISILSISETPGLGMRAEEVLKPQFTDKNVTQFEYTKSGAVSDSQIDAISGATITTNAITNGVNAGLEYFRAVIKEGL